MLNKHPALLGILLAAAALGCGDFTRPGQIGDINLQVVDGEDQIGLPGQELPEPIVVQVTDQIGRPVAGVLINFVVTAGGGHVFAGSALTNASGEARERWTLGAEGENVLEARSVDQETGAAIVHATIRASAQREPPGAPAGLYFDPMYYSQYRLLGRVVQLRDFVYVYDADGQLIPDAPLAISADPGLLVAGNTVQADPSLGREVSGMVRLGLTSVTDSFRVGFLPDLTPHRWRATYSCSTPWVYEPEIDSIVNIVALSDSVRQDTLQLGAHETYVGLNLTIYMQATGTAYYDDGRVEHGELPSELATHIPARLFSHRIEYGSVRPWWLPAPGGMEYSPANSDGTLPPTYLGGDLCDPRFASHTPGVLEPVP